MKLYATDFPVSFSYAMSIAFGRYTIQLLTDVSS